MANIRNTKLTDHECAGYTFNSNFDSGNLGRVELVRCASDCKYNCMRNFKIQ